MKRTFLFALVAILALTLPACGESDVGADGKQAEATAELLAEADRQVGMPNLTNFQERKWMKMIMELRDREDLVCHAYLYNRNEGTIGQYLGACLGFGLPYSVQFTNPERVVRWKLPGSANYYQGLLPQADPNGLFMPQGLSATWLLLLDKDGEARPVYVEPEILVSPFKLHE